MREEKMEYTQDQLEDAINGYSESNVDYISDCEMISWIAYRNGYQINLLSANAIWKWYSSRHCAEWLTLYDEKGIIEVIEKFIKGFQQICR